MMRAMVLEFPAPISTNPLHLMELPPLLPGPGEVLVQVNYCGICHTDLHIVEGELPLVRLPLIPGHQVVGQVVEVGPRTARFRVGDRVGLGWLQWACGQCHFCRNGLENLCEQAQFTGFHRDGGYAQMMVAPAAFAYRLPENFPDLAAAPLLCAGIIGYRALKISNIKPGGRLGLYGFGGSAHIAIQVARHWNCEVFVFTRGAGTRNWPGSLEPPGWDRPRTPPGATGQRHYLRAGGQSGARGFAGLKQGGHPGPGRDLYVPDTGPGLRETFVL